MGFDAHVLKVLIASPSDTTRERDAIEKALYGTEFVSPRYKTSRTQATQQRSSTNSPTAYR